MSADEECRSQRHHCFAGVRAAVSSDIRRYLTKSAHNLAQVDNWRTRLSAFLTPELISLFLYRISHYLQVNGWTHLAALVARANLVLHKVNIAPQSCIGAGCRVPHPAGVTFLGTAGTDLTLYSLAICSPESREFGAPAEAGPRLGDRVTVGGHAVVIGPVRVGSDTKIAYSMRLDRDTPAGVLVVSPVVRPSVNARRE
jgi:serine O-acetyltransferase